MANINPSDQVSISNGSQLTRHNFPSDFFWGTATSAYQVEGGYSEGRRSYANWDAFSMEKPAKISGGSNGCVAIDNYNRIKEDVALMKKLGLSSYRFSIAWSRILPGGRLSAGVNREGVRFYNELIDLLLSAGIEPFVTIFHFDVPDCLELEYDGFLKCQIVKDFSEYAEVCFFEFGDRVKFWITENEPWTFTHNGYITGNFPPGHGSSARKQGVNVARYRSNPDVDDTTFGGDAGTEPYRVAHNLLLAHAAAVDIYRKKYQAVQQGKIGVTNMSFWYFPYSDSPEDVAAAARAVEFMWGWFVAPIVTGDYPLTMRKRVGSRLPEFTTAEKRMLRGSFDFIGMNYYTSNWASYKPTPPGTPPTYYTDQEVEFHTERYGIPIGQRAGSSWLFIVPYGLYKLLVYTKEKYNDPLIYITENGVDAKTDNSLTITEAIKDEYRIKFYQDHFAWLRQAMDEEVNVKGFHMWSLFDNYEWASGYTVRFGIYYVDYVNGLVRYPKYSAIWYMDFLNKNVPPTPSSNKLALVEDTEPADTPRKRLRDR